MNHESSLRGDSVTAGYNRHDDDESTPPPTPADGLSSSSSRQCNRCAYPPFLPIECSLKTANHPALPLNVLLSAATSIAITTTTAAAAVRVVVVVVVVIVTDVMPLLLRGRTAEEKPRDRLLRDTPR